MKQSNSRSVLLQQAWLGDAVLALYVRERILREQGKLDGELYTRMTSNHFLSAIGEPSAVEAEIGEQYRVGGLAGAFEFIEQRLIPVYERQEANRRKRLGIT
ncbi:MAG: ribonuclease III domain-containing protein [Acidobacteria bacterium]|nr:ribonuclease III domain-containing protein [Acidobacteriota bacterium]